MASRPFPEVSSGAIIIPAHNEGSVLGRTLDALGALPQKAGMEVIVVCNGCTDATADVARGFSGVHVAEIAEASKAAALNEGDRIATRWPRLYLDADVEITANAVAAVFERLQQRGAHGEYALAAARPPARYDTSGGSAMVRAYYRARSRVAGLDESLWGAGAYALNENGHRRFGKFPSVIADDLFIDRAIPEALKAVIETDPVTVRTPRDSASLQRILQRGIRANGELAGTGTSADTFQSLLRSIRGPLSALDAFVYASFAATARLKVRFGPGGSVWERDDSSR